MGKKAQRIAELEESLNRMREFLADRDRTILVFKERIKDEINQHRPKLDQIELGPGWSTHNLTNVRVGCTGCAHFWPCKTINTLRDIYGEATGWEPARRPIESLKITVREPAKEPESESSENEGDSGSGVSPSPA